MLIRIFALGLATFCGTAWAAASVEGDWAGTLQAGPQRLRLALHVSADDKGKLAATMDSLDQGAMGLAFDAVTFEAGELKMTMTRLKASYSGTLSEDGESIEGTWTQGPGRLPLRFSRRNKASEEAEQAAMKRLEGAWAGALVAGSQTLRFVLRVERGPGGFRALVESPDQGPAELPASGVRVDGATVHFEVGSVLGSYDGELDEAGTGITGVWKQSGVELPLTLKKTVQPPRARRPQYPREPLPYKAIEVDFLGGNDDVVLAGTLTVPNGEGPFPAVVLISGSGPQDRDETVLGHKPFLVLSDYLTRNGIAVLRYDDRGTAKSTGDFSAATSLNFAGDAESAVRFLEARREVNPEKIGLIGHSEGALIAPMVANRGGLVAFLVLLAPPGVPGDLISISQTEKLLELRGAAASRREAVAASLKLLFTAIAAGDMTEGVRERYYKLAPGILVPPGADTATMDMAFEQLNSPWMRFFLSYDPIPALKKLRAPALALWGEKDQQVLAGINAPPVQAALAAGHPASEAEVLPSLNHLLQTSETGDVLEYARIEETMATVALERIASWLKDRVAE